MAATWAAHPAPRTLVLAVDGSEDSDLAARTAANLVRRHGSELHVVHAWRTVPSARFEALVRRQLHRAAEELLAEQVRLLEGAGVEVAQRLLREGAAIDCILDVAAELEGDMIVMGSRGMGPIKRLALGSVAEGVVHHANIPVLLMRGNLDAWPPERVVVGDDASASSLDAGRLAAILTAPFGVDVVLLRVVTTLPPTHGEGRYPDGYGLEDELGRQEWDLLHRAREIEELVGRRPDVAVSIGDPTACLLETAGEGRRAKQTLIAVGNRGLGPVRRLRFGSVSTKVVRAAQGPILVHPFSVGDDGTGQA